MTFPRTSAEAFARYRAAIAAAHSQGSEMNHGITDPAHEGAPISCWIEVRVLEQMRDDLTAVMRTLETLGVFASSEVKAHLEDLSGQIEQVRALTVPDSFRAPAREARQRTAEVDDLVDAVRNAVMAVEVVLPGGSVVLAADWIWNRDLHERFARAAVDAIRSLGVGR